jgi:hypothetical protein
LSLSIFKSIVLLLLLLLPPNPLGSIIPSILFDLGIESCSKSEIRISSPTVIAHVTVGVIKDPWLDTVSLAHAIDNGLSYNISDDGCHALHHSGGLKGKGKGKGNEKQDQEMTSKIRK